MSISPTLVESNLTTTGPCTTKKDTSVTFWAERIFFYHTYDTSMMIIVTKPGIIRDVECSYFYDKKSWHKMGFSFWPGLRCSCLTFFGPSMTEKTAVEARARKISGEFPVTMGGRGTEAHPPVECTDAGNDGRDDFLEEGGRRKFKPSTAVAMVALDGMWSSLSLLEQSGRI